MLVGDFDNDGVSDKVVWRPSSGSWYILKSSDTSNGVSVNLGISSDTPFVNRLASASTSNVGVYRAKQKAIYFRTLTSGVISVATKASNKAKLQK